MSITTASRRLGATVLEVGPIAFGLWRFVGHDVGSASTRIHAALDAGLTLIDVAAVYGLDWGGNAFGESEALLGKVLARTPALRSRMVLATKFGIIPSVPYDSSAAAIIRSCEESLNRLQTDCIDLFQVHRPDVLTHPAEVAEALTRLRKQGKIREVGVSNYTPAQSELLQSFLLFPIATTQPEFSALKPTPAFDGTLDAALRNRQTPLAWSPLAGGRLGGNKAPDPALAALVSRLDEIAASQGVSRASIALAFVMRHPAGPIPIIGTQSVPRIAESMEALNVSLSRTEWYSIVSAQGTQLP